MASSFAKDLEDAVHVALCGDVAVDADAVFGAALPEQIVAGAAGVSPNAIAVSKASTKRMHKAFHTACSSAFYAGSIYIYSNNCNINITINFWVWSFYRTFSLSCLCFIALHPSFHSLLIKTNTNTTTNNNNNYPNNKPTLRPRIRDARGKKERILLLFVFLRRSFILFAEHMIVCHFLSFLAFIALTSLFQTSKYP